MNPSLYPEQPQQPMNTQPQLVTRHRKKYVIIVAATILVIGAALYAWYASSTQGPTCLTRTDYQTLSGEVLPDDAPLTPSVDFYGFDINFAEKSTAFVDSTTNAQLSALGEFVTQHPSSSVIITLQAMYSSDASVAMSSLMTQRISAVKSSLTKVGIKPETIKTDIRTYSTDPYNDAVDNNNIVTLAVTSSDECR